MAKETPFLRKGIYKFDTFNLSNFDGSKSLRIDSMVKSLQFEESILGNAIYGQITLEDANGFFQFFPMIGEETLTISFVTDDGFTPFTKTFKIYNISELEQHNTGPSTGYFYLCRFASTEFLKNETTRFSRGYNGMYVSDMVSDIYESFLRWSSSVQVNIEKTTQQQQLVIPYLRPFEAINFASTYATSDVDTYHNLFLFYEDRDGFNFTNLVNLYKANAVYSYSFQADSAYKPTGPIPDPLSIPNGYTFKQSADKLNASSKGMFANTVVGVDLLAKSSISTDFSYADDFNSATHVDDKAYPIISGSFQYGNDSQAYKVVNSRNLRTKSSYFNSNNGQQSNFSKSYETLLPYRLSMMQQLNYMVLQLSVGGNTNLKCGLVVNVNFPDISIAGASKGGGTLSYYTGSYLIKGIKHLFTGGNYTMQLLLIRDCLSKAIGSDNAA